MDDGVQGISLFFRLSHHNILRQRRIFSHFHSAKSLFLVITLSLAFIYNILSTWVYSYDIKKYYEYLVADTYNWYVNDKITAQFQAFCDNDYYKTLMKDLKVQVPTSEGVNFLIKIREHRNFCR